MKHILDDNKAKYNLKVRDSRVVHAHRGHEGVHRLRGLGDAIGDSHTQSIRSKSLTLSTRSTEVRRVLGNAGENARPQNTGLVVVAEAQTKVQKVLGELKDVLRIAMLAFHRQDGGREIAGPHNRSRFRRLVQGPQAPKPSEVASPLNYQLESVGHPNVVGVPSYLQTYCVTSVPPPTPALHQQLCASCRLERTACTYRIAPLQHCFTALLFFPPILERRRDHAGVSSE